MMLHSKDLSDPHTTGPPWNHIFNPLTHTSTTDRITKSRLTAQSVGR